MVEYCLVKTEAALLQNLMLIVFSMGMPGINNYYNG